MTRKRKRRANEGRIAAAPAPAAAFPGEAASVQVDGSLHEGGGQMVRTAVGLGAALGISVHVSRVRAGRSTPGLRAQHVTGALLAADVWGGTLHGAQVQSQALRYDPARRSASGGEGGSSDGDGRTEFDAALPTAGAAALVLQAALPALVARGVKTRVRLRGGTHVPNAPTAEYVAHVLVPTAARFGVELRYDVTRRGFFPRGGGAVDAAVETPARAPKPWRQARRARVTALRGFVVAASRETVAAAQRMADSAQEELHTRLNVPFEGAAGAAVHVQPVDEQAAPGGSASLTLVADTEDGGALGASITLDRRAAREAGFDDVAGAADKVGRAVADELADDLLTLAAVDRHMADQVGVLMALSHGESSVGAPGVSLHMRSVQEVVSRFGIALRFEDGDDGTVNVVCSGVGSS